MDSFTPSSQPEQQRRLRGCLPDAMTPDAAIILKACRHLKLTYEIRLATFMAIEVQKTLRVLVPDTTTISPQLEEYARKHRVIIEKEKQ